MKEIFMTSEGYKQLVDELEYLKTEGLTQAAEKIAVARGFGDLSENAEYDEAMNDQGRLVARIAELETEVKLRDANTYTLGEVGKLRDYFENRLGVIEREICDQRTYNAVNTATIGCIQGQVASLLALTKTVIPNSSICPGWGNVTVAPAAATT